MEKIELLAEVRMWDEKNNDIRKSKMVPGVVYGHSQEPISLKIDSSSMLKVYRKAGESHIINLKVGKKNLDVLVHDYQKHPLTGDFSHVDFYAITKWEKLTVHIHLNFVGTSAAKREGGIVEEHLHALEVKCLPTDLVDGFDVDLSKLVEFGDSLRVSDIVIDSKKFEVINHMNDVVVSVSAPKVEVIENTAPELNLPVEEVKEEKAE